MKLDEAFAIYSRIAFDTYLRERAAASGAQVFLKNYAAKYDANEKLVGLFAAPTETE